MGKALLIIMIAAALGGSMMMYQTQSTERQTSGELAETEAEFLAREAARSGYEVGVGDAALYYTARATRANVETANVPQGTYDLTIEETPDATLAITATGRASHGTIDGAVRTAEHTMWGEFSRIVEAPSAVVIDAEEVASTFYQDDFVISGNDQRPFSTVAEGAEAGTGLGTTSYAVLATQPGVASAFRAGLSSDQMSRLEGRGEESAGGAIAQSNDYPALLRSIYDEAAARVSAGESDVVSYVGDRVFAGTETFGSSPRTPKVVHIDGDVTVKGKVHGHGVLIVDGDLTIEGQSSEEADNFRWEGAVFVRQDGEVSFSQTGATRIEGGLVVQAPPAETTDDPIDFDIDDDGEITVNERFAARVEVLGAAISAGGQYDVPVTIKIEIDNDTYAPWGDNRQAVSGNINDANNPRSFDLPDLYEAGERIVIEARSFLRYGRRSGRYNSDWSELLRVKSGGSRHELVKVLRNGDRVPRISGFMNQTAIAGYVQDYVVDGRVRLDDNQAIYLFELGETNTRSDAADFQDAVVLVTLSKEEEVVRNDDNDDEDDGGDEEAPATSRVNFTMGGEAKIQYSSEALGRLAAQLQSARAVASVGAIKQRSYDPALPHEEMPAAPEQQEDEDGEIGEDALVTVCLDGETQTIAVGLFELHGDDATLGPCVETNAKVTVCHRQGTPNTLEIGEAALPAHLAHGDTVGACSADEEHGNGNAGNGNSGSGGNGNDGGSGNDNDDGSGNSNNGGNDDGGWGAGDDGDEDEDEDGGTCDNIFDWIFGRC
jgi:hypothetical protein